MVWFDLVWMCIDCTWTCTELSKLSQLRVLDVVCNNLKKLPKVGEWGSLVRLDARSNCLRVC